MMFLEILRNMGLRYVLFRMWYSFQMKTGLLKHKFPPRVKSFDFPNIEEWRETNYPFVTDFKMLGAYNLTSENLSKLEIDAQRITNGEILFFSHEWKEINSWWVHPVSGYEYPRVHFTEINDFSKEIGDIKYIWEKARFSWLFTLIRHDKHCGVDHAEFVLDSIENFIDDNPVNIGPHYKCSQEMSLRVFNWSFALFFYKNSKALTPERYSKILKSISGHYLHIRVNINFSRIAVRNNHAITETLALFVIGKWFPFLPNAKNFGVASKKWFEQEIEYQLYPDGGFLQYSHNYHRVVIQLLTLGILTAKNSKESFDPIVYERAKKSVKFLEILSDETTGWLPNYGQNDGALFFPLNQNHYRDFRPQLSILAEVLNLSISCSTFEDSYWFNSNGIKKASVEVQVGRYSFDTIGQYIIKEARSLTVLNNPSYINRPAQSDQLHLDIHVDGSNVIFDPGTFRYNTTPELVDFYFGTTGHNTLQLGSHNQMEKGSRFIWLNWVKSVTNNLDENEQGYYYSGDYYGFKSINHSICVKRKVKKHKEKLHWIIEDSVEGPFGKEFLHVRWNVMEKYAEFVKILAFDEKGESISPRNNEGWNSVYYGAKEKSLQQVYVTSGKKITTEIIIDENITYTPVLS